MDGVRGREEGTPWLWGGAGPGKVGAAAAGGGGACVGVMGEQGVSGQKQSDGQFRAGVGQRGACSLASRRAHALAAAGAAWHPSSSAPHPTPRPFLQRPPALLHAPQPRTCLVNDVLPPPKHQPHAWPLVPALAARIPVHIRVRFDDGVRSRLQAGGRAGRWEEGQAGLGWRMSRVVDQR